MIIINRDRYGCRACNSEGKHACTNGQTVPRVDIEARVLAGLRSRLMNPELVKLFVKDYIAAMNARASNRAIHKEKLISRIIQIDKALTNFLDTLATGLKLPELHDRMATLSQEKQSLEQELHSYKKGTHSIHPNVALLYHEQIENLHKELSNYQKSDNGVGAADTIKKLITAIEITPGEKRTEIHIEVICNSDTILNIALTSNSLSQSTMINTDFEDFSSKVRKFQV